MVRLKSLKHQLRLFALILLFAYATEWIGPISLWSWRAVPVSLVVSIYETIITKPQSINFLTGCIIVAVFGNGIELYLGNSVVVYRWFIPWLLQSHLSDVLKLKPQIFKTLGCALISGVATLALTYFIGNNWDSKDPAIESALQPAIVSLIYAITASCIAAQNMQYNARRASTLFAILVCGLIYHCCMIFNNSTDNTSTFPLPSAILSIVLSVHIVNFECVHRMDQGKRFEPVLLIVFCAAALINSLAIGASRAICTEESSQHWLEIYGALFIIPLFCVIRRRYRSTERYRIPPLPLDARAVRKLHALAMTAIFTVICVIGSYLYRQSLPNACSPMPFFICFLLFASIFLLDGLRTNISYTQNKLLAVTFGTSACIAIAVMLRCELGVPETETAVSAFVVCYGMAFYFALEATAMNIAINNRARRQRRLNRIPEAA